MHRGVSAPSCCAFIHRVAFKEGSGPRVLLKSGPGNQGHLACVKKQNMTSGHPGAPFSGHSLLPPRLLSSDSEPVVLPLSFPQHAAQPHLAPTLYVVCCACWLCPGVSAMCPCLVSGLAPEEPQHLLMLLGCPGRMLLAWLLWHNSIAGSTNLGSLRQCPGNNGSKKSLSF